MSAAQHTPGPFGGLPFKVVNNAFGKPFTLVGIRWERGVAWVNAESPEARAAIAKATGAAHVAAPKRRVIYVCPVCAASLERQE